VLHMLLLGCRFFSIPGCKTAPELQQIGVFASTDHGLLELTVELGQTPDQVKAALGAPDKVIKLGAKEVYVYKDIKVVFVDGKVSDVQ
jgi:hypothetical protein